MGYKLAGFDVLGCNEIDPRMAKAYIANHHPKYCYVEPIQTFRKRKDLPKELYNLDILDGSPPCSSFSMAGVREKKWGVKHKFREGQQEQVLDTLFFDFIALANKLRPKVVIAENVKGLLKGRAKEYLQRILHDFDCIGYYVNYLILDASTVGVPQKRERVFFYAVRKDLWHSNKAPKLRIHTFGKPIAFGEFSKDMPDDIPLKHGKLYTYWKLRKPTDRRFDAILKREFNRVGGFNNLLISPSMLAQTIASGGSYRLHSSFREPNRRELCCMGTFPQDYDFVGSKPRYIIGMSVPPFMMRAVAEAVRDQILPKLKTMPVPSNATANKRKVLWLRRNISWSKKKCRMQKLLK